MNIDTIIGMIDALKQASYELGYMECDMDWMIDQSDLIEQRLNKEDLLSDIREKIINALHQLIPTATQLTDPFEFVSTSTIEDVDLEN